MACLTQGIGVWSVYTEVTTHRRPLRQYFVLEFILTRLLHNHSCVWVCLVGITSEIHAAMDENELGNGRDGLTLDVD